MNRFIVVALLLHIPLFAYPVLRISAWMDFSAFLTALILVPVFFSQIFARRVLNTRSGVVAFVLRSVADFILGVAPVVLLFLLVAELLVLLSFISEYYAAMAVLVASSVVVLKGMFTAFNPMVNEFSLVSDKLSSDTRLVHITDVHIGSRSSRFLSKLMDRINRLNADALVITGDFIDQPEIGVDLLKSLKTFNGPIYYTIGNHERYEDLDDILARLEKLGVNVLRNRLVEFKDIQIVGIDDEEDALQVSKVLKNIDINTQKYSILLYHRPVGLEACSEKGVDLMLSGHTHGGQIIPFNLVVNKVFDRVSGIFTHGDSTLYVSQGTGTWGPVLRVGTKSEIALFNLRARAVI